MEEETERRIRQVSELEKEKVALSEERNYLSGKLTREKEECQKHTHTISILNSELANAQQQVNINFGVTYNTKFFYLQS